MIYTPTTEKLWDCWILKHNDTFYMFHLSLSPERLGKGSWDGISLATSKDLTHWTEYGRVFEKRPEAEWIGTGMVQKIGDKFIMNYSEECPAGKQAIYFAESSDLIHWKRIEGVSCEPDGKYYMNKPSDISNTIPRWDSIGIVDAMEDKQPPYYGFVTSNTLQCKLINKSGSLGLLKSEDGLHWECLPNAFPDTDRFPEFEVPEHVEINGRHYVMFCTSSYLGFRFDELSDNLSGGTFYVTSDSLLGPYRLPDGDYMLQGTRNNKQVSMVTVGRPLKIDNKIYYYHIWGDNGPEGWVGTVKLLDEETPYKLRLLYNKVNDSLVGRKLADSSWFAKTSLVKNVGAVPPMIFSKSEKAIEFTNLGTSAALEGKSLNGGVSGPIADLTDGRIVEACITIKNGEGAGIYFTTENGNKLGLMLNKKRQRVEFGRINNGWGANMAFCGELYQSFTINETSAIKLLARREFFELYIDGVYASSWRSYENINPNSFGLYFEDCDGRISDLNIYEMK